MEVYDLFKELTHLRAFDSLWDTPEFFKSVNRDEEVIQTWRAVKAVKDFGQSDFLTKSTAPITNWNKRQTIWQNILLTNLSKYYDVFGFIKTNEYGKIGFYACGRQSNLNILERQYSYITNNLDKIAGQKVPSHLKRGSAKAWYNDFYLQSVDSISSTIANIRFEKMIEDSIAAKIFHLYAAEAKDFYSGKIKSVEEVKEVYIPTTEPEVKPETESLANISMENLLQALMKMAGQ